MRDVGVKAVKRCLGWSWGTVEDSIRLQPLTQASSYHSRGPAWTPILFVSFSAGLIWLYSSWERNKREQGNQNPEILGPL